MKPPLFSCLAKRSADNGSLYGRFLFGPLPVDTSLTVATVLRRSLLHSQATFSIVSAEIEGATHEYASLPGIQESVLEILLNLGEIVLTSTQRNLINPCFRTAIARNPFFFANIRVSGPGLVTAKDINWPKGIFCVKPNSVICTLSSKETLTMRLKIACSFFKNTREQPLYENEIHQQKSTKSDFLLNSFEQTNAKDLKANKSQLLDMPLVEDGLFNLKNQNQFDFFKVQEKPTSSTLVQSLETTKTTKGTETSVNESHFIRIQSKNLILSKTTKTNKTKEKSKDNNLLYQQTIQATQRLLTTHKEFLDSYSIRKKKQKQELVDYPLTNKETIFYDNKSRSKINVLKPSSQVSVITKPSSEALSEELSHRMFMLSDGQQNQEKSKNKSGDQSQDLDQNVTFRIFPGLFNDFIQNAKQNNNQKVDLLNNKKETSKVLDISPDLLTNKKQKKSTLRTFKHELLVSGSSYPVEKVNFLIERDDELAGYRHRIILEVWTNGSISPRQAIFESIGSIIKLIYNFREPLRNSFN